MPKILLLSDHSYLRERTREIIETIYPDHLSNVTFATSEQVNVKSEWQELAERYRLIFSIHCKQIFPRELVESTLCVNLHPGFNPYNRGWFPHVFSIINGLPAGATLHVMDAAIDHGPIITQEQVPIHSSDTSTTLYARVLEAELRLFEEWFPRIVAGDFKATAPASDGNINTKRDYEALKRFSLHEQGSFQTFYNRLRALSHDGFWNAALVDDYGNVNELRLDVQPLIADPCAIDSLGVSPAST